MADKIITEHERKTTVLHDVDVAVLGGGTAGPSLERSLRGKQHAPGHIQVDPEILSLALLKMVEEAGVKLLLHTDCYDVLTEDNSVTGLLVHNKEGRAAGAAAALCARERITPRELDVRMLQAEQARQGVQFKL